MQREHAQREGALQQALQLQVCTSLLYIYTCIYSLANSFDVPYEISQFMQNGLKENRIISPANQRATLWAGCSPFWRDRVGVNLLDCSRRGSNESSSDAKSVDCSQAEMSNEQSCVGPANARVIVSISVQTMTDRHTWCLDSILLLSSVSCRSAAAIGEPLLRRRPVTGSG